MDVRYYRDPETGLPHIYQHGVTESEVEGVLAHPAEDQSSSDESRQALGQTAQDAICASFMSPTKKGMAFLW